MRFLCDMGVSRKVSEWLQHQRHDSTHLGDEGLARLPNGQIFAKAFAEKRIILTWDLDFGEIAAMSGDKWTSIVVFRLRNTRTADVIQRLSLALQSSAADLEKGAIVVVEDHRIRVREFPI
jgi:predicted nuclease of predicted toxin-antitoxin system